MVCGAADIAQLRWAVRGAHEQRDIGLVGLDDRRVQLGRRRAARAEQDGGAAAGQRQSQGQERRRPLVVVDVKAQLGPGGQREGERGRA